LKKLAEEANERDEELRNAWFRKLNDFEGKQLVFLDETGINSKLGGRKYGRGPKGAIVPKKVQSRKSVNLSVLPTFTLDGYIICNVYKGGMTADEFHKFIEDDVLPKCNPWPGPRSVIIMDNAKIHRGGMDDVDYELENYGIDDEDREEFKTVRLTKYLN
jgi:hypothetical protein